MGLFSRRHDDHDAIDRATLAQVAEAEAQRREREAWQAYNRSIVKPVFGDPSRQPAGVRACIVGTAGES